MVNSVSYDTAVYAANTHEIMELGRSGNIIDINFNYMIVTANFDLATLMDLWNNSVGQNMAGVPKYARKTKRELFDYALLSGKLITSLDDVLLMYGIDESYLNDGKILGMWNLETNSIQFYDSTKIDFDSTAGCPQN